MQMGSKWCRNLGETADWTREQSHQKGSASLLFQSFLNKKFNVGIGAIFILFENKKGRKLDNGILIWCQNQEFKINMHCVCLLADPGKARACTTNALIIHSLTDWLTDPLVKISLRRRNAQWVQNGAFSQKQMLLTFFKDSKSWRETKLLYWFKRYGNIAELVDFDCWWSCIKKGLRLQPAQQI